MLQELSTKTPTAHDYTMALASQSACNLSGIVFEFAKAMERICAEARQNGHGTDWRNNHPIARLYAEQIAHLTSGRDWDEAHKICEERAQP